MLIGYKSRIEYIGEEALMTAIHNAVVKVITNGRLCIDDVGINIHEILLRVTCQVFPECGKLEFREDGSFRLHRFGSNQ